MNSYEKLSEALEENIELLTSVFEVMLLKPNLVGNTINFHCRTHVNFPDDVAPAVYNILNRTYVCSACEKRSYESNGDIFELVRITYKLKDKKEAYDQIKKLIRYIINETFNLEDNNIFIKQRSPIGMSGRLLELHNKRDSLLPGELTEYMWLLLESGCIDNKMEISN